MPLRGLDAAALSTGQLLGPYVNVLGTGYATGGAPVFDVTRSDPRFEGLMAYAHLDRYQRYLQALGFQGTAAVNAEPQDVVPGGLQGYDNSFYYPTLDVHRLGDGGVDDGEDAEVVLHEYGHAVQDRAGAALGWHVRGRRDGRGLRRLPGRGLLRAHLRRLR